MRIDATQIALIPRTNEQCLTLATMVLRRFATRLGPVWLASMLFSLLLIVPAIDRLEWTVAWAVGCLIPTLFAYGTIQTGMLSAAMFGDPCSLSVGWKTLGKKNRRRLFVGVFLRSLIPLLGVCFAFSPLFGSSSEVEGASFFIIMFIFVFAVASLWIQYRNMFKIEHDALSALTQNSSEHRVKSLVKDSLPDLIGRMFGLMIVAVALTYSLFLTLDFLSNLIFTFPIISNRIPNDEYLRDLAPGDRFAYGFSLLGNDPRAIGLLSICVWCIYPVIRLAWMLSYIDLRIRRDCWDVALKIDQEAERLGVTT